MNRIRYYWAERRAEVIAKLYLMIILSACFWVPALWLGYVALLAAAWAGAMAGVVATLCVSICVHWHETAGGNVRRIAPKLF